MQRILIELAEVIGLGDTIEITRRWGGRTLAVPMSVGPGDPLALTLGLDTARKLVAEFRGVRLQLPAERNALLDMRNASIARDVAAGASQEACGVRYGLTRQGVAAVLRKMRELAVL
jgi:hypothetical protein